MFIKVVSTMGNRLTLLFAIFAVVGGLSGCAQLGLSNKQTYEVIGEASDLTPEQQAYILKNRDSTVKPIDPSSHSVNAQEQFANPQYASFEIRKNESLYSVINRLNKISSYSRMIYDISNSAATPDRIKAKKRIKLKEGKDPLIQVEDLFRNTNPYLRIFLASDNGRHALVVSDKPYPTWTALAVYDVKKGTLKDAASDLARTIGWQLEPEKGYQAQNFPINNPYPIIISPADPKITFIALLYPYPAKAQLNPNTRSATIVTRVQPRQD